jgi:hypothetical protein
MNRQDAAAAWSVAWSVVGARPTRTGSWAVTFTRPVGPETCLGEIVSSLAEVYPRALEAVLTVDLRRRERTVSAAVYMDTRDEALQALAASTARHPPAPGRP